MIIAVCGLPGSGKSYFATKLATKLNFILISSDKVRRSFLKNRTYSADEKLSIYDILLNKMEAAIGRNEGIILDATFYKKQIRDNFIMAVGRLKKKIIFIKIEADLSTTKERLSKKRRHSEADYDVYLKVKSEFESLKIEHLTLHSTQDNIEVMLQEAESYIQKAND